VLTVFGAKTLRPLPTASYCIALTLALVAVGCHQPDHLFGDACDSTIGLPSSLLHESDCTTASIDHIAVSVPDAMPPRTTTNPEAAEVWELSLAQALQIALENSDVVRTLTGFGVSANLTTAFDPAIAETQVQSALAAFDTTLATSLFWNRNDQPPGITFGGGIPIPNQRDQASFTSSLSKLLVTGGTAEVAFNTNYLFIPAFRRPPGPDGIIGTPDDIVRTPAQYSPNVEFSLRQPLLRGAGADVQRSAVVIARLQSDQSQWDFKLAMLELVRSVEQAYWELHAAHVSLRAIERVVPLAQEVVRIEESRLEFQKAIPADVAQARAQFHEFRQQRVQALNAVLEREALLRNLLGLVPSDERRIVPSDEPARSPIMIDWSSTLTAALNERPDVVRQRLSVRVRELQLIIAKDSLRPQLDAQALWRISGLDRQLDEAIGVLTDNQFTDWQIGVTLNVPLGFRQASANVHAAELTLDRDRVQLRQAVHATSHQLGGIVRELESLYQQYQAAAERLEANNQWLDGARIRFENPPPAGEGQDSLLQALSVYQVALSSWSQAAVEVSRLLAQYNTALARLEEAKGTLLAARNISLHEDPCARVRIANRLFADLAHPSHSHDPTEPILTEPTLVLPEP